MRIIKGVNIKIYSSLRNWYVERSCEHSGKVSLHTTDGVVSLPANKEEAREFIQAYKTAVDESIDYVDGEYE